MMISRTALRTATASRAAFVRPLAFSQVRFQSTTDGSTIKHLTNLHEFEAAMKADNLSLVDFFATWCGPCKAVAPHVQKLSEKYSNVKFYKVDVDESPDIAGAFGISSMPTFVLFKNGKGLGKVVGADPRGVEEAIKHFNK
ncbi:Trx3 [Kluyveromyces lactis]|nr:Trx3 [Kluyveromyces lactis]